MLRPSFSRAAIAAAVWAALHAAAPPAAVAYDAILAWKPVAGAAGYRVYHSGAGAESEGAKAVNVGAPSPGEDGVIRYVVQDVPLDARSQFAVSALDAAGRESERSNVMVLTRETVVSVLAAAHDHDHDEITAGGFD